jgi:hypothetical protein
MDVRRRQREGVRSEDRGMKTLEGGDKNEERGTGRASGVGVVMLKKDIPEGRQVKPRHLRLSIAVWRDGPDALRCGFRRSGHGSKTGYDRFQDRVLDRVSVRVSD